MVEFTAVRDKLRPCSILILRFTGSPSSGFAILALNFTVGLDLCQLGVINIGLRDSDISSKVVNAARYVATHRTVHDEQDILILEYACYGVRPCYGVSPFYGVSQTQCYVTLVWVTRPECPKGAKDEVKSPEVSPARRRVPEGP